MRMNKIEVNYHDIKLNISAEEIERLLYTIDNLVSENEELKYKIAIMQNKAE